ncbi:hypothetical protein Yalta_018 [Yalta virus]|nr:hypothetical protein Yalta_018 [Yalta virus]
MIIDSNMNTFLNYILYQNSLSLNNELLQSIDVWNTCYTLKKKHTIEIVFVNPYRCITENAKPDRQGLFICVKVDDIESTLLEVIDRIPKNGYVYFINFFGYNKKISNKIFPNFQTLLSKNILIIF